MCIAKVCTVALREGLRDLAPSIDNLEVSMFENATDLQITFIDGSLLVITLGKAGDLPAGAIFINSYSPEAAMEFRANTPAPSTPQ